MASKQAISHDVSARGGLRGQACLGLLSLLLLVCGCSATDALSEGQEPANSDEASGAQQDDSGPSSTAMDNAAPAGSEDSQEPPQLQGIVAAHNAVRLALNEGLEELVWSQELADVAQDWANTMAQDCQLRHRPNGEFGENLASFGASPNSPNTDPADAVSGWAEEVACYSYGRFFEDDACDGSCIASLNSNGCGHYTQVVWRDTERVGCGFSTCTGSGFNWEFWVCNYDPPGNFVGQFPY